MAPTRGSARPGSCLEPQALLTTEAIPIKILAIDHGEARTGLAICDPGELLATPLTTIQQWDPQKLAAQIAQTAKSQGAQHIVLGLPLNMDGSEGPRAQACRTFAALLEQETSLPVTLWDERSTTITAARYLNATDTRGKKRKAALDPLSAAIILESYLTWRKNHPEEEG